MADNHRAVRALPRRVLGAALLVVLVASLTQVAAAEPTTKQKLDAAEAEFERLTAQIRTQQRVLDRLGQEAAVVAQRMDVAQARFDQISAQLNETRDRLDQARADYAALRDQLEERAREAYMQGPGNAIAFLLGASSLIDLSDRVEFVNALSQSDADLATQVENLRNELAAKEAEQERLRAEAARALKKVNAEQAALDAKLAEQQDAMDTLQTAKTRAAELVTHLKKQYQRELAALSGLHFDPNGIFQVCPVDQPRAVYDGFGAPRFAGGYHPHAGNDIIAPMGIAIRAPFPGTAHSSWNALGGNAVYVYGANGYVYNAHLSAFSPLSNGSVQAGDIIGYVGNTGDAQGGVTHDHFEWHPNVIPSDWPASAYGYSVIGTAVNPFPLLAQVC